MTIDGDHGRPPLAPGSISLRLYPHDELGPAGVVEEFRRQARLAEQAGFDGVMLSEHHGGFPNYVPNPLLATTWTLDATETIWAAPCPQLLPLRPVSQIVEDLAWTAARFPGRVGAGFAAGALPLDFEMAGVPFDEMNARFVEALPRVAAALAGRAEAPLVDDAAVAALRDRPIPVVSAAQSLTAARRAAACEVGLLFDSIISIERAAQVTEAYREAGGRATQIMVRRVWIGEPPATSVATQMSRYQAAAPERTRAHWAPDGGLVADTDPDAIADRLDDQVRRSGCDALNLRVFQAGVSTTAVGEQIERLGTDVLARLVGHAAGWTT